MMDPDFQPEHLLDFPSQGDGNPFQYRMLNREWQVYGSGLYHICRCQTEFEAKLVCDNLNFVWHEAKEYPGDDEQ